MIISLELEIFRVAAQEIHRNTYDYGANSSEVVENIAKDQEDYQKSSLGVINNIFHQQQ